jgi:hypothetical protein
MMDASVIDFLGDSRSRDSENTRHVRQERRVISFRRFHHTIAWVSAFSLYLFCGVAASADEVSSAQMRSLDEQVQEIKSDVLSIAAELKGLEEKLLYPSDTQVSVFISLAEDEKSRFDSVQIQIDGEAIAHHIYSFKELEALKKGGVQRIYTGNLPTGVHLLAVSVAGKLSSGRDFSGSETFQIEKEVGPKLVGVQLAASEFGSASIELGGQ